MTTYGAFSNGVRRKQEWIYSINDLPTATNVVPEQLRDNPPISIGTLIMPLYAHTFNLIRQ